jgi:hypothetical protein
MILLEQELWYDNVKNGEYCRPAWQAHVLLNNVQYPVPAKEISETKPTYEERWVVKRGNVHESIPSSRNQFCDECSFPSVSEKHINGNACLRRGDLVPVESWNEKSVAWTQFSEFALSVPKLRIFIEIWSVTVHLRLNRSS